MIGGVNLLDELINEPYENYRYYDIVGSDHNVTKLIRLLDSNKSKEFITWLGKHFNIYSKNGTLIGISHKDHKPTRTPDNLVYIYYNESGNIKVEYVNPEYKKVTNIDELPHSLKNFMKTQGWDLI